MPQLFIFFCDQYSILQSVWLGPVVMPTIVVCVTKHTALTADTVTFIWSPIHCFTVIRHQSTTALSSPSNARGKWQINCFPCTNGKIKEKSRNGDYTVWRESAGSVGRGKHTGVWMKSAAHRSVSAGAIWGSMLHSLTLGRMSKCPWATCSPQTTSDWPGHIHLKTWCE